MSGKGDNVKLKYDILFNGVSGKRGLLSVSVNTAVNKIPRAKLEYNFHEFSDDECDEDNYTLSPANNFDSTETDEELSYEPGSEVEVSLGWDNEKTTVFKGIVIRHHLSARNNGQKILTLDCKHKANLMTLATRTRVLHQEVENSPGGQKVATIADDEILRHLVEDSPAGLGLNLADPAAYSFGHENMVQYECSDWDFLVMRAEATARVCLVDNEEIRLMKPKIGTALPFDLDASDNLLEYEAELNETVMQASYTVSNWSVND
ncbi:MAG: hypothetical protein WBA74_07755, partial [Cyclobacteriaceae bacterium]